MRCAGTSRLRALAGLTVLAAGACHHADPPDTPEPPSTQGDGSRPSTLGDGSRPSTLGDGSRSSTSAADVRPALPPSDRVFVARSPSGDDWVFGADGAALWAIDPRAGRSPLWRIEGRGAVQAIAAGDIGHGHRLYVVRGMSRTDRAAPLSLDEVDPASGRETELWHNAGERNEVAHLSVSDVDRDGKPDLAFAYFASKYEVRTRHLRGDGRVLEGPPIRMATTRLYADVDGDGIDDEIVGRLYGDAPQAPGDLHVDLGHGPIPVPTDRGVRAAVVAARGPERPVLYFADGWDAAYGTRGRAQLKRARWIDGRFQVEEVATSQGEYTFFDLCVVDVGGRLALVGRGSKRATLFSEAETLPWTATPVAEVGEVLQTACGRDPAGRWNLYVPGASAGEAIALPTSF